MLVKVMSKHLIFMSWVDNMFLQVYYFVFPKIGILKKSHCYLKHMIFLIAEAGIVGGEGFLTFNLFFFRCMQGVKTSCALYIK